MNEEELEIIINDKAQSEFMKAKAELSEEQKFKIEKEAEAKAVFDKATEDPKALVKAKISQGAISLVENDEKFKEKMNKTSEESANTAINEVQGDNRKTNNASYFAGREQAITSMGGNSETSTDKQKYMNAIYTGWWYVIMTILGIFFIAPLKVLLNWGFALSPEQTKVIETDGVKTTEKVKKIHWLAGVFALLFYVAYLVGFVALIIWIVGLCR